MTTSSVGIFFDRVLGDRNAAAVVHNGDGVVGMHRDLDGGAEAGHGLVHRIVHDFPHQMVQTAHRGRTNVHAWALADGLEALEDLNLARAVFVLIRHVISLYAVKYS